MYTEWLTGVWWGASSLLPVSTAYVAVHNTALICTLTVHHTALRTFSALYTHCTMTGHCTQTGPINLPPASRLKLIFFLQRMTSLSTMRPMDRTIPILDLRNVFLSLDDSFFIHHLKFSIWTIIYTWSKNNVVENGILFEVKSYKTFNNQIVCGPFSHPSRHYTI